MRAQSVDRLNLQLPCALTVKAGILKRKAKLPAAEAIGAGFTRECARLAEALSGYFRAA